MQIVRIELMLKLMHMGGSMKYNRNLESGGSEPTAWFSQPSIRHCGCCVETLTLAMVTKAAVTIRVVVVDPR